MVGRPGKEHASWRDGLLLECGCAYENFSDHRHCACGVHLPGTGNVLAETAGESKRPECVLAFASGKAGDFVGAGADPEAAII